MGTQERDGRRRQSGFASPPRFSGRTSFGIRSLRETRLYRARPKSNGEVRESLDSAGVVADQLLANSLEEVVEPLLSRYAGHAVFLFVDPFGLAVSRETLESVLTPRIGCAARCFVSLQYFHRPPHGPRRT